MVREWQEIRHLLPPCGRTALPTTEVVRVDDDRR
jgi:hypothetical protein